MKKITFVNYMTRVSIKLSGCSDSNSHTSETKKITICVAIVGREAN